MTSDNKHSNFVFTLNNYTTEQEDILAEYYKEYCRYLLYGHEVAPSTGMKHLQGYLQLRTRKRLSTVKNELNKLSINKYNQKLFDVIHLEAQRASDNKQARDYCKKEGDFIELGEFVEERARKQSGSDLLRIVEENDNYYYALSLIKPHQYNLFNALWANKPNQIINRDDVVLRPWQQLIYDKYIRSMNDRDILIVCDKLGNSGKSFFCNYLEDTLGAFVTTPMKSQDILYAYKNENVICFDFPRSDDDKFMFSGTIESLKNGRARSGKYGGRHIHRDTPAAVLLFTNSKDGLEMATKFSNDRVILCYFNQKTYERMKWEHPEYRYELLTL